MPRDPFLTAARCYVEDLRPFRKPKTIRRLATDLRVVSADLWTLRRAGKVANVRPARIQEEDVAALLLFWRERPRRGRSQHAGTLDPYTQRRLLGALDQLLIAHDNPVVSRMKSKPHVRFPRGVKKPIDVLDEDDLGRLREGVERFDGWEGSVARLVAGFLPYTMLRPNEFRLARDAAVTTDLRRILVTDPKGLGSWAAPDYAPILPPGREPLTDFRMEREAYLGGGRCEWLVPYRRMSGEVGPWSEGILRKLVGRMRSESGVRFSLKTLRATCAQILKDRGADIEDVSRGLRHASTATTEEFYARLRPATAFRNLERAFERPRVKIEAEEW